MHTRLCHTGEAHVVSCPPWDIGAQENSGLVKIILDLVASQRKALFFLKISVMSKTSLLSVQRWKPAIDRQTLGDAEPALRDV